MKLQRRTCFRSLALALLTCATEPVFAQNVRVLGLPGGYAEIQPAVNAAPDGGILLVDSGTYGPVVISGKSLSIFASPGAVVRVQGSIFTPGPFESLYAFKVASLSAARRVVVSGIEIAGVYATNLLDGENAVLLESNQGPVHFQSCTLQGGDGAYFGIDHVEANGRGGPGARVFQSSAVSFAQCIVRGGAAAGICFVDSGYSIGDGGGALIAIGGAAPTSLVVFDSELLGGDGGYGGHTDGSSGGTALTMPGTGSHSLHLAGSTLIGGDAGWTSPASTNECNSTTCGPDVAGRGGNGLSVSPASLAFVLDTTLQGGAGGNSFSTGCGPPGVPATGSVVNFAGAKRSLSAAVHVVTEGSPISVTVAGAPGDFVELFASQAIEWSAGDAGDFGVWLVDRDGAAPPLPLGMITKASSAMHRDVKSLDVADGVDGAVLHLQARVVATSGQVVLTNALSILVLRPGF